MNQGPLGINVIQARNPSYHFRKIFNGKICPVERNPRPLGNIETWGELKNCYVVFYLLTVLDFV